MVARGFRAGLMQEEVFRGEAMPPMIGGAPSAPGNGATWESVLGAPAEGQHVAQLYTEPDFLEAYRGLLQRVSTAHSHLVPVED
jgi:hypothetical protein